METEGRLQQLRGGERLRVRQGLRGFFPRAEGALWNEMVGWLDSSEYIHWAVCFWKEVGFTLPELQLNTDVLVLTASPPP